MNTSRGSVIRKRKWLWASTLIAAALVSGLSLCSCTTVYQPDLAEDHVRLTTKDLAVELRASVEKLSEDIGERNCHNPDGLEKAAVWIEEEFQRIGYTVKRLPVNVPDSKAYGCAAMTVWNLEVIKQGTTRPDEIIVVGAHYDSKVGMPGWHDSYSPCKDRKGTPGANDNATGVAATLALARMLRDTPTERTIHFVAFVNEEPPFFQSEAMGSLVYAKALTSDKSRRVVGMISPETLGNYSPGPQSKRIPLSPQVGLSRKPDYICFLSNRGSVPFTKECSAIFQQHSRIELRHTHFPQMVKRIGWSDDWAFWKQGVPAFAVTDTAFLRSNDYHELSDTADKLDFNTMAEVVWGLRYMLEGIASPNGQPS
ncbi:MAG: M20/M25/M40 family metallo-hydrolase [Puniceicoccales bacterium]|jgi:hypothetical protein|nr:M20/M25/M40 family metallo-hydrolase [Puniceicoccales bacterium]